MNISSWSLRNRRYDGLKLLTSRLGWIFIIKRNKKRKEKENIPLLEPLSHRQNRLNLSARCPLDHKEEANEKAIG